MPPNSPEKSENKEASMQQVEGSMDDQIAKLRDVDEQRSRSLAHLKSAIMEKIVIHQADEKGAEDGDKSDDLRISEAEMREVFSLLQNDQELAGLLEKSGIQTPENFLSFLGLESSAPSDNHPDVDTPMSQPPAPPPPEGTPTSAAEVNQKRDQIINYHKAAYDLVCYDYEAAAKQAGFKNRKEADKYLSALTGSEYGTKLKSGDIIKTPDGQESTYFATSKEALEAIEASEDYWGRDGQIIYFRAHAYAEKQHQVLNVNALNSPTIYAGLVRAKVFELPVGKPELETGSGVTFERTANGVYFNSQTDDNTWGRLDTGGAYFVKFQGNFLSVTRQEHFGKNSVTAFVEENPEGGKQPRVFNNTGNYDAALTAEY